MKFKLGHQFGQLMEGGGLEDIPYNSLNFIYINVIKNVYIYLLFLFPAARII